MYTLWSRSLARTAVFFGLAGVLGHGTHKIRTFALHLVPLGENHIWIGFGPAPRCDLNTDHEGLKRHRASSESGGDKRGKKRGNVTLGDHCHRHTPSRCTMLCYNVTTSHCTRFCYLVILNALHCFTVNVLENSFHRLSKCTAALAMREVATLQMKLTNMRAQRHGFGYPLFLFLVEKTTLPHFNYLFFSHLRIDWIIAFSYFDI